MKILLPYRHKQGILYNDEYNKFKYLLEVRMRSKPLLLCVTVLLENYLCTLGHVIMLRVHYNISYYIVEFIKVNVFHRLLHIVSITKCQDSVC